MLGGRGVASMQIAQVVEDRALLLAHKGERAVSAAQIAPLADGRYDRAEAPRAFATAGTENAQPKRQAVDGTEKPGKTFRIIAALEPPQHDGRHPVGE